MSYLLKPLHVLLRSSRFALVAMALAALGVGLGSTLLPPQQTVLADDDEDTTEEKGENDANENDDEQEGEEKEAGENEDGEGEGESMEEGEHEASDDSLVGRLERVKQLIAEGKVEAAQAMLDEAISQAREMSHEHHDGEDLALDREQLQSLINDTRSQMLATLETARIVGDATNAVEAATDKLMSALDELRPTTAIAAAVKETRAKAREIFREARKNPDTARVLRESNVAGRFEELMSQAGSWRGVEEHVEGTKRQVAEQLAESGWQNELDEMVARAIGHVRENLSEDAAENWTNERFEQAARAAEFIEMAQNAANHTGSVFGRDFVGEMIETVTQMRAEIEGTIDEADLATAWEQALSQAAAEHPEVEAFRNNEHAARLRTVLADFKSKVATAFSSDMMETSLRAQLGDLAGEVRGAFEPANIESKWQELVSGFETRIQQLREEAEQKRIAEEEAARKAEEEAEAAEAARRLAEEQAEGKEE